MSIIVTRKLIPAQIVVIPPPSEPTPSGSGAGYPNTYPTLNYQERPFSDVLAGADPNPGSWPASWESSSKTFNPTALPGVYADDLHWKNVGGDWKDSNGALQGASPLAQVLVTLGVARNIPFANAPLLTKIKAWIGGAPNYGFMLRGTSGAGSIGFNTMLAASNRPTLSLTSTSLGPLTINCTRCQWLKAGTTHNETATVGHVTLGTESMLFWFDLSAYTNPADITAATLNVWSYGQFGANTTVGVFEVWNPGDTSDIEAQLLGVAAKYDYDSGLENDAAVLWQERLDDSDYEARWSYFSPNAPQPTYVTVDDPTTGFTKIAGQLNALCCHIQPGDPAGGYLNAEWSPWRDVGRHVKALAHYDELYCRYYVLLGTDWNPQPDGGKMPGWDLRFKGNVTQPWDASHPNGIIPGMGNGNGGTGCDGYTGGSIRGAFAEGTMAGDPLDNGEWLRYGDVYNVDQEGMISGQAKSYGNLADWGKHYLGWLRRGKWYCVDQYVKLNTVTARPLQTLSSITSIVHPTIPDTRLATATIATDANYPTGDTVMQTGDYKFISGATPDEYNTPASTTVGSADYAAARITVISPTQFTYVVGTNLNLGPASGTIRAQHNIPNRNGITRAWINGRLAHEKMDWGFRADTVCRDGVTPYSIDYFWANVYFGGGDDVVTGGHLYMGAFAVGTSYIGPMVRIPTWLLGQPTNKWIRVTGSSLSVMGNIAPADMQPIVDAGLSTNAAGGFLTVTDPRSGTNFGYPRGNFPNSAGLFAYSGGTYKRDGSVMLCLGGGGATAWAGNEWRGLRMEDDAPRWKCMTSPTEWRQTHQKVVGPGTDYAYMFGPYPGLDPITGPPNARHSYWQHQFDDNTDTAYLFGCRNTYERDSGQWNHVDSIPLGLTDPFTSAWTCGSNNAGTILGHPDIPHIWGYDGPWRCKDPRTQIVYAAGSSAVDAFNPATNSWAPLYAGQSSIDSGAACVDTAHNVIIRIAAGAGYHGPSVISLTTGVWTICTFSGTYGAMVTALPIGTTRNCGFVFDPGLGKAILFIDDRKLYTIEFQAPSTLVVEELVTINPTSAPAAAESSTNGSNPVSVMGRMQYLPNLRGVCLITAVNQNAYFVRTS